MIGLALFTLIGIGIRLLMMFTIQQRRERMNRQINERLRTLIAAYKVLGGSFTGDLTVDPTHLRDLRRPASPSPRAMPQRPWIRQSTAPWGRTVRGVSATRSRRLSRTSSCWGHKSMSDWRSVQHASWLPDVPSTRMNSSYRCAISSAKRSISSRPRPILRFRGRAPGGHRVPVDAVRASVEARMPGKAGAEVVAVWGWVPGWALVSARALD